MVASEDHGYKVLVEQAVHEMHRNSFDLALNYLNRALSVIE